MLLICRILRTQEKRIHFHLYLAMIIQVKYQIYFLTLPLYFTSSIYWKEKSYKIIIFLILKVSVRLAIYLDQQLMKKRISHEDQITFNNAPSLVCVSQPKLSKIPIMNTTTNLASNSIDVEDDDKENLVKIRTSNIDHH